MKLYKSRKLLAKNISVLPVDSGGSTSASSLAAALQSEIRRRAENKTPGSIFDIKCSLRLDIAFV